ncbi:DEAD/DEAH box helicase [Falsiroseomonas stagni]|nr:DEAD/DEAH box helicase [Falsiroseomonas stagni]
MLTYDQHTIRLAPDRQPNLDACMQAAAPNLRGALARLRALSEEGLADMETWPLTLSHTGAARLTPAEAAALGLPPASPLVLRLDQRGIFPDISVSMRWQRPTGAPAHGVERVGSILRIAGREAWLPDPLHEIAEAVTALSEADDDDARMRAVLRLKDVLPEQTTASVQSPGALLSLRLVYADAFTLDLADGDEPELIPFLRRNPADLDDPGDNAALPDAQQDQFRGRFNQFTAARGRYALGGGTYVVLSKPLQEALQVVREVQSHSATGKREFFRNPRPLIAARLGEAYNSTVIENLFRETKGYSDRVLGLGLWQPKVLPWVQRPGGNWFGPEDGAPSALGLRVGDRSLRIATEQVAPAVSAVESAVAAQRPRATIATLDGQVELPATESTLSAVRALRDAITPTASRDAAREKEPIEALLILDGVDDDSLFTPAARHRPTQLSASPPMLLATSLKLHQEQGLTWLCTAWNSGAPGVLLADDMGLGKTLQVLAFMATLRDEMRAGTIPAKPMLIVAPTGLLANWEAEHDRHLHAPGLGRLARAFGTGLKQFAGPGKRMEPALLQGLDWVLTTYETLRDNQAAFADVPFALIAFDEAQKIKNPGVQMTHAAKGMNADFAIAMTGTPVENRLADLWCILDTVHPGLLGPLKAFSQAYEASTEPEKLAELRRLLEQGRDRLTAPMLRRLKIDHLKGLPEKRERRAQRRMPEAQADAYRLAIAGARTISAPSAKLIALQSIRRISLHPDPDAPLPDADYIGRSARLSACFDVLDEVAHHREKALIFLDDLSMQANLAALIQRRYRLPSAPLLINGGVAGLDRQRRVDRFQNGGSEFDVMILSPRAGGVGLTLTAATHVIHLSRWWNPAVEDQCTDRAYRIGQNRPVTVHTLLALLPGAEDDSFDVRLDDLLSRKRRLSRELLQPPAGGDQDRDELFQRVVG